MANTKANVIKDETIMSLKDGAYKQAVAIDKTISVAKYVIEKCSGFPETISDESKAQLYEGYRLRFNEKNPPHMYAIINDHYLLLDGSNPELENANERHKIGVDFAMSYTQQQFGKLKSENPYLYPIVKDWRDRINTYCSNRLADLKRQARITLNEGKTKERGATADFNKRIEDTFSDLAVKCKNAESRGDETANQQKFMNARIAFMAKWNA